MKARIEKKLSKRLIKIAPAIFQGVWLDRECSELAYAQRTSVSNVWSTGGGTDYWGDGLEAYTLWADWLNSWPWVG